MCDSFYERIRQSAYARIEEADRWMATFGAPTPEYVKACWVYAICHKFGLQKPKDESLMFKYFKEAASHGHAGACYELARLLVHGSRRDFEQAEKYTNIRVDTNDFNTDYYNQSAYLFELETYNKVIQSIKGNAELWSSVCARRNDDMFNSPADTPK